LQKLGVKIHVLEYTADIWCRDYMPVPVNAHRMVQFKYEPSYLKDFPHLRTCPEKVLEPFDWSLETSSINLDGGNVLRFNERVLVSDRVFDENPHQSKTALLNTLEKTLQAEIILIPQIKSELTGHVDGMVRFIDSSTLLVNDRTKEFKYWVKSMEELSKKWQLTLVDMPLFHKPIKGFPHNALGCYLNYLELSTAILMPVFEAGGPLNESAFENLTKAFPNKQVYTIEATDLARYGGVLNCATWTV
jgi:agmatine deiminase